MGTIIVFFNLLCALALGALAIWLGSRTGVGWWSLIVTIPIALSILSGWANWVDRYWS